MSAFRYGTCKTTNLNLELGPGANAYLRLGLLPGADAYLLPGLLPLDVLHARSCLSMYLTMRTSRAMLSHDAEYANTSFQHAASKR